MAFLLACAAVTVLTTAGIVLVLGVETVRFFRASGESASTSSSGPGSTPRPTPRGSASCR